MNSNFWTLLRLYGFDSLTDNTNSFLLYSVIEFILSKKCLLLLREKSPYLESFWSVFSRIWTEYEYLLGIFSEQIVVTVRRFFMFLTIGWVAIRMGATLLFYISNLNFQFSQEPIHKKLSWYFVDHKVFCLTFFSMPVNFLTLLWLSYSDNSLTDFFFHFRSRTALLTKWTFNLNYIYLFYFSSCFSFGFSCASFVKILAFIVCVCIV